MSSAGQGLRSLAGAQALRAAIVVVALARNAALSEPYYFWGIDGNFECIFEGCQAGLKRRRRSLREMRQLTENEIRDFYQAYRAMEARARVHHRAAMRHLIQRDFLFFALVVAVFLGVLLYHAP